MLNNLELQKARLKALGGSAEERMQREKRELTAPVVVWRHQKPKDHLLFDCVRRHEKTVSS